MNVTQFYIDKVFESTSYSGSHGHERIISASGISNDILPLYLKIKYGLKPEKSIEPNTIGTLLHTGVDRAFNNVNNTLIAYRRKMPITDDFILSGETDIEIYDEDTKTLHIIDNKLVKFSVFQSMMKDVNYNYYHQLKTYEYLAKKEINKPFPFEHVKVKIAFYFKDASKFVNPQIPAFKLVDFTDDIESDEEFEKRYSDLSSKLDYFLKENDDNAMEECSLLFWNKTQGDKAVKERCKSFCDVNGDCPYYKKQKESYKYRHKASMDSLLSKIKRL